MPFCLIQTWPFGKAEPSNLLALIALIVLNFIHLANSFSMPAIVLFINQYLQATAPYSPIILP